MDCSVRILIQEEEEVAECESCFFQGMSILCKNSNEAKNSEGGAGQK